MVSNPVTGAFRMSSKTIDPIPILAGDFQDLSEYLESCEPYLTALRQAVAASDWRIIQQACTTPRGMKRWQELQGEPFEVHLDASQMGHLPISLEFSVRVDDRLINVVAWLWRAETERRQTIATFIVEQR